MATLQHATAAIDQQHVARGDFRPVQALRIDQIAIGSEFKAEMIANALIEPQPCSPSERRGQIDSRFAQVFSIGKC